MSEDNSVKDEIIAKCRMVSREGLYVMVFIILMQTCNLDRDYSEQLDRIEKKMLTIEEVLSPDESQEKTTSSQQEEE